jgi:methionyl-tRNA synthetase
LKSTKNWFLPLDKLQPKIEAFINSHPEWKPNVFGQCKSWLNQQLQPRAMTRDLDWGVKVPVEGADGKVLYVWFDAPIGYISATKELFSNSLSPLEEMERGGNHIGKTQTLNWFILLGKIILYSIALFSRLC